MKPLLASLDIKEDHIFCGERRGKMNCVWTLVPLHYTSPFHTFQGNHQIFQWNFSGMCVRLSSITFPVIWSSILSWFQWLEWRYRGLVTFFRKNNIAKMLVCPVPKISQVMMKWHRRTSQLGRFTLWTSNLSPGLTNIWTSRSLLWWVVLRR